MRFMHITLINFINARLSLPLTIFPATPSLLGSLTPPRLVASLGSYVLGACFMIIVSGCTKLSNVTVVLAVHVHPGRNHVAHLLLAAVHGIVNSTYSWQIYSYKYMSSVNITVAIEGAPVYGLGAYEPICISLATPLTQIYMAALHYCRLCELPVLN